MTPKKNFCAFLSLSAILIGWGRCQSLRKLGQISASHAAFANLVEQGSGVSLVVSTFNPIPLTHDTVYKVDGLGQGLDSLDSLHVQTVTTDITWPNEVTQVPDAVFNRSGLVLAAGGFLVPFKDHGSLTLIDLDLSPPLTHLLSGHSSDGHWFYHRGVWRDVNGDGLDDLVTCRARTHLFGSTEGQLVWFQHPRPNAFSQPWTSHVIATGPDVFFTMTSLPTPQGDVEAIVTSGYFSKSLNVYWSSHPQGRWDDPHQIQSRVIDNSIGAVFDVIVDDVNNDGRKDLLVTNNAASNASLFVYTVPSDFRTGVFSRQTLAHGFGSRTSGVGHGAPGSPLLTRASTSSTSQKPLILLSGDDGGQAYVISPSSSDVTDWTYQQTPFIDAGRGTVGGIAVGDVDRDGYNEVFVPSYDEGLVYVFTFKPQ